MPTKEQPGPIALLEMIMGSMVTQAIHVAARLGFADILADGPRTADDIAARAGADADATHRLLRTLASFSIFTEELFSTNNDIDNRAAVMACKSEDLRIVGLALRGTNKVMDKILKGLSLHT